MKKGDFVWLGCLLAFIAFVVFPKMSLTAADGAVTQVNLFGYLSKTYPYWMGFGKVAILASMGELLGMRIFIGSWKLPVGMPWRTFIWGLFGVSFALVFGLFGVGVIAIMKNGSGLLPDLTGGGWFNKFFLALITSSIMNLVFAPMFMALHRITDTYIDLCEGKISNLPKVSLLKVTSAIDWNGYVGFICVKTLPIFWIPAHTFTFCLPPEYRVLSAAMLSICLGAILSTAKRKSKPATAA